MDSMPNAKGNSSQINMMAMCKQMMSKPDMMKMMEGKMMQRQGVMIQIGA
jgi:hypothetical protein